MCPYERPFVSAVIPALNEEGTVGEVVSGSLCHVDEVIVVDDGSSDETAERASAAGARILRNQLNRGVLFSLRRGFQDATGSIVVTLDADGQHDPGDIPRLIEPIVEGEADLVLGRRPSLPYFSERVIAFLTSLRVRVGDASTGFRAIRRSIAVEMDLHGSCTCGTFVLEAYSLGARVAEVPVEVAERSGERRIQTRHFKQVLYVVFDLIR